MKIEQLVEPGRAKGFIQADKIMYGTYQNFPFAAFINGGNINIQFTLETGDVKPFSKALKPQLNKGSSISLMSKSPIIMLCILRENKNENVYDTFTKFMDFITREMKNPEYHFSIPQNCPYCKNGSCDSAALVKTYYANYNNYYHYQPVHRACVQNTISQTAEKVEQHQRQSFYPAGLIGAIIGAVIGTLPAILLLVFLQRDFGVAYFLIPIASYKGYEICKGPRGNLARITVILCSILAFIFMQPLNTYLYSLVGGYGYSFPEIIQMYLYYFTISDIVQDAIFGAIFLVIGIAACFKQIGQKGSDMIGQVQTKLDTLVSLSPAIDDRFSVHATGTSGSEEDSLY